MSRIHTLRSGRVNGINLTAQAFSNTSVELKHGITVLASSGNTAAIFVGPSGVTAGVANSTCGFCLAPNTAITLEIDNLNKIYVVAVSGVTGHEAFWTGG